MAAADLIITHIDSALHFLAFLDDHRFMLLRFRLKNLKKLVQICGRELGNQGNLTALLVWIEDVVGRMGSTNFPSDLDLELDCYMISMQGKIDEWYHAKQSSTPDDVLGNIGFISEALVDVRFINKSPNYTDNLQETIEALEEQMSFMKTLITYLATEISDESLRDLLAHSETLTTNVVYLLSTFVRWDDLKSKISMFLQKMQPVYETYSQALTCSRLQGRLVMDDVDAFIAMQDFLDSLISDLWDLLRIDAWPTFVHDLQQLYGGLRSLRTILKKQPNNLSVEIKQDIRDAVCDAGVFICLIHETQREVDLGLLKNLLDANNSIFAEIGANEPDVPMLNVLKVSSANEKQDIEVKRMRLLGDASLTHEIVGFQEEERLIVDQLVRGSQKLQIVAIVGMAGLGKTTLATKVYNNLSVSYHFHLRAKCHVSHVVDKKKVLLDILSQIDSIKHSQTSTEQDFADALRKSLKGRKYLIFLDDVWDIEALSSLKESFPDDTVGSRLILTSRQHDVAPLDLLVDGKPYFLRQLNQQTSLELLQMKLSGGLTLDLGMKIAGKCCGLPLIIVIVAGVLKHAEPKDWNELLDCLSSITVAEQCRNTLELSYKQLPAYLRPCLLYFGIFPENQKISARRLLRLWIAENFIQTEDMNSLEDAAEDGLNDLIGRSLIMIAKHRSLGGVKSCRVHDLIHDFCLQKAKDEHLFHFLRGYDELSAFNEPHNLQRLCIHSDAEHFKQSKLFCPRARSLILNSSESKHMLTEGINWRYISSTFRTFKLLRVLDLEHVHFGYRFPSEIQQLVHLNFLAILSEVFAIPLWIGNLSNLETLIVLGSLVSQSPDSLWNLQKLQYLYADINGCYALPMGNLDSPITLHNLDRISGVVIPYSKMESLLRKFPNIRRLKCNLLYSIDTGYNLVFPAILSRLQSLTLLYDNHDEVPAPVVAFDELSFPENLKKLALGGFSLSSRNLSTIGKLSNLEVLKLAWIRLEGEIWEMKEEGFAKLKILKLVGLNLVKWCSDCDDDSLYCLQKLILRNCTTLKELPSCIDCIPALEVIEVSDCHDTVIDMVREVEKRREDLMGDSGLKIIVKYFST